MNKVREIEKWDKALRSLYLVVERTIADDVNEIMRGKIKELSALLAEKDERIRELENMISGDLEFSELKYENGRVNLGVSHPLNAYFIASMIDMFNQAGGKNYLACTCYYRGELFEFIIQRKDGITPSEKVKEIESELSAMRERASVENIKDIIWRAANEKEVSAFMSNLLAKAISKEVQG